MAEKPTRTKKGQNLKGVENKREKAKANLAAGRAKRAEMLKKKRDAEKESKDEYDLDSGSSDSDDEEIDLKEFVLSKKADKPTKKTKASKQPEESDMRADIANMREAILKLAENTKKPKRKARTKLVVLPQAGGQAPQPRQETAVDSYAESLRQRIIGR